MAGKRVLTILAFAVILLAGCSGSGSSGSTPNTGARARSITEWDYETADPFYTSYGTAFSQCTQSTGIAIQRTTIPQAQLLNKVLLAASQKSLPDLLLLDVAFVQTVAATGALAPLPELGVNVNGLYPNLLKANTVRGKIYGVAPGVDGLALVYNKTMFKAAGLQPPTTWAEIQSDAKALTNPAKGIYGMAFSAVGTEEGSFQFEPWLFGAGGRLDKLDSPQAVQALHYLTGLVSDGYASKSVLTWRQTDVNTQFLAGKAAMEENGDFNLNSLESSGIDFGIVPIPKPGGGSAPIPLGGQVLVIPNSGNRAKMEAAAAVLNCIMSDTEMTGLTIAQKYIPARKSLAAATVKADPNMKAFVDSVSAYVSRTGPPANLGSKYSKVSQALWTAVQAAISGEQTPQAALTTAQQQG